MKAFFRGLLFYELRESITMMLSSLLNLSFPKLRLKHNSQHDVRRPRTFAALTSDNMLEGIGALFETVKVLYSDPNLNNVFLSKKFIYIAYLVTVWKNENFTATQYFSSN